MLLDNMSGSLMEQDWKRRLLGLQKDFFRAMGYLGL